MRVKFACRWIDSSRNLRSHKTGYGAQGELACEQIDSSRNSGSCSKGRVVREVSLSGGRSTCSKGGVVCESSLHVGKSIRVACWRDGGGCDVVGMGLSSVMFPACDYRA